METHTSSFTITLNHPDIAATFLVNVFSEVPHHAINADITGQWNGDEQVDSDLAGLLVVVGSPSAHQAIPVPGRGMMRASAEGNCQADGK